MHKFTIIEFKEINQSILKATLIILFLTMPISRSLFALCSLIILITWIITNDWKNYFKYISNRPTILISILFPIWMFISLNWSEGSEKTILDAIKVNWQLFLIPIIASLVNSTKLIKSCWHSFAAGMIILLIHIYSSKFINIPWANSQDPSRIFYNPLPQSIGLSIFCAWCLIYLIDHKPIKLKFIYLILFCFASYAIFEISQQRLGYISWLISCSTVLIVTFNKKQRILSLVLFFSIFISLLFLNDKINSRFLQAKSDISSYDFKNNYTSVGARIHMWYTSILIIKKAPWIGHGMGSYPELSKESFNDPIMCEIGCKHPHNQYIFYWFEFGFIGLILFASTLIIALKEFIKHKNSKVMSIALLMVLILSSLADSTLWYRGFLYLFVPLLGLCLGELTKEKQ